MEHPAAALPEGMHYLSPHLVCSDTAAAIDFYKAAFDAVEMIRMAGPDGRIIHACVNVNGSSVMLVDEFPEHGAVSPQRLNGSPVTIHLVVRDVDGVIAQAEKTGATVTMPPADMFWGDRYGTVRDPFGHNWSFGEPQRQLSPAEMKAAADAAMSGGAGCGPDAAQ